jgi:hypothetical protein
MVLRVIVVSVARSGSAVLARAPLALDVGVGCWERRDRERVIDARDDLSTSMIPPLTRS